MNHELEENIEVRNDKNVKDNQRIQNRIKSWPLWLSVGALIVFAVKQFGGMDISVQMSDFLNVLCPVLVGFGIINNPTDKKRV